jgi:hypothetical protein
MAESFAPAGLFDIPARHAGPLVLVGSGGKLAWRSASARGQTRAAAVKLLFGKPGVRRPLTSKADAGRVTIIEPVELRGCGPSIFADEELGAGIACRD